MGAYGSEQIANVANSLFSPISYYHDTSIEGYKQDLEFAKRLIEETGLKNKTLSLIFNANRANQEETALIIQQQMKNVGITLEITPLESNGFFAKAFGDAADYDMYLNGYAAPGDPDVFIGMFNGTWGINVFVSDEAKALWAEGSVTVDEIRRADIYKRLQVQAKKDMTIYPIAFPNYCFVADRHFQGFDALTTIPIFEDYMKISVTD
jgi:peptide/nickel transport system substrate-binding protein